MIDVVNAVLLVGGLITLAGAVVALVGMAHLAITSGVTGRPNATQNSLVSLCYLLLIVGGTIVCVGGTLGLVALALR